MDIDKKMLRAIKKECREMAREMTREHYKLYDDIWWDRIKIDSALYDHGKETIREINQRMPNLLTHDPNISPLDIVSERYGFESTSDLVDFLLAYTPRGPVEERYYEQMLESRLREYRDYMDAQQPQPVVVDDVPF